MVNQLDDWSRVSKQSNPANYGLCIYRSSNTFARLQRVPAANRCKYTYKLRGTPSFSRSYAYMVAYEYIYIHLWVDSMRRCIEKFHSQFLLRFGLGWHISSSSILPTNSTCLIFFAICSRSTRRQQCLCMFARARYKRISDFHWVLALFDICSPARCMRALFISRRPRTEDRAPRIHAKPVSLCIYEYEYVSIHIIAEIKCPSSEYPLNRTSMNVLTNDSTKYHLLLYIRLALFKN